MPAPAPHVALRPMQPDEVAAYRDTFIADWGADLARVEHLAREQGHREAARRTDDDLLSPSRADTRRLYAITADDRAVGALWIMLEDGRAFISDITVAELERGKGYGRRALELMEHELAALGVSRVVLSVYAHNPRARALYESLGYAAISVTMSKPIAP